MGQNPQITEVDDPTALVAEVRRALEASVAPGDRITVPTGRTPSPLYDQVIADPQARALWGSLRYLQLDEYIDPPTGTESFAETLARQLFDPLGIPFEARGSITAPADPAEGPRLDRLHGKSGLAVCLLGLGSNGHIAFNEPGDRSPGYHRVTLTEETTEANFGRGSVPVGTVLEALTIGIDQILAARRVLLWVPQPEKQALLDRVLTGPIDPQIPATALRKHPNWAVFRARSTE